MRLSDQDGALVREYARARLAATAAQIFGPANARHYAQPKAMIGYLARRRPEAAEGLQAALDQIEALPPRLPPADAIRHIDTLEAQLEHLTDDT